MAVNNLDYIGMGTNDQQRMNPPDTGYNKVMTGLAGAGEVVARAAATPLFYARDVANMAANGLNNTLGVVTGYKFPGSFDTSLTGRNLNAASSLITEGLQGAGAVPTTPPIAAPPAAVAAPPAVKPDPKKAAEDALKTTTGGPQDTARPPQTPPVAATSTDPGSGFATFNGKTINYADIGIKGKDPLMGGTPATEEQINTSPEYAGLRGIESRQETQRSINFLNSLPGGATEAVKNKLGFIPDDYYANPAKYQEMLAKSATDLTGQGHLLAGQGALLNAQNETAYRRALGYEALMRGNKEAVQAGWIPEQMKAEIGVKAADTNLKEAETRKNNAEAGNIGQSSIASLTKNTDPATALFVQQTDKGIKSGTLAPLAPQRFTALDVNGTSQPFQMWGAIPNSAQGKAQYKASWDKYLADVNTYNSKLFRTTNDLKAMIANRQAFFARMEALGLKIDPVTDTLTAAK